MQTVENDQEASNKAHTRYILLPSLPNLSKSLADLRASMNETKAFMVSSGNASLLSLSSSNIGVNSFNLLAKLQYCFLTVHLYSEIEAISLTMSIKLCTSALFSSSMALVVVIVVALSLSLSLSLYSDLSLRRRFGWNLNSFATQLLPSAIFRPGPNSSP